MNSNTPTVRNGRLEDAASQPASPLISGPMTQLTIEKSSRSSAVADAIILASTKGRSRRPYSLIDP